MEKWLWYNGKNGWKASGRQANRGIGGDVWQTIKVQADCSVFDINTLTCEQNKLTEFIVLRAFLKRLWIIAI